MMPQFFSYIVTSCTKHFTVNITVHRYRRFNPCHIHKILEELQLITTELETNRKHKNMDVSVKRSNIKKERDRKKEYLCCLDHVETA